MVKPTISFQDFDKVDIRLGRVIKVEDFKEAINPSYKLWIDFGSEIGVKTSSAQIKKYQSMKELQNRQVVCVVNFEPKQVGPFRSEVLTLGIDDGTGDLSKWILLTSFKEGPLGGQIR